MLHIYSHHRRTINYLPGRDCLLGASSSPHITKFDLLDFNIANDVVDDIFLLQLPLLSKAHRDAVDGTNVNDDDDEVV